MRSIYLSCLFFGIIITNIFPQCMDFEKNGIANWKDNNQVKDLRIQTDNVMGNQSKVLYFLDGSGGSIVYNDVDFRKNWIRAYDKKCISFDYKISYNASVEPDNNYAPKIMIYKGNSAPLNDNNWPNGIQYATFISNTNVSVNNQWKHYELPIGLSNNGNLPSNSSGHWQIDPSNIPQGSNAGAIWDIIIQNVRGVILPVDYNKDISEKIYFDNFCFKNCEVSNVPTPQPQSYPACCPPILEEDLASLLTFEGNLNTYKPKVVLNQAFKDRLQAYINYRKALDPCFTEFNLQYYIKRPAREPDQFDFAQSTNLSVGSTVFRPNQNTTTTWGQPTLSDITLEANKWYRFGISFYGGPNTCSESIQKDCSIWWIDFRMQTNQLARMTASQPGKSNTFFTLKDFAEIKN